VRSSLRFVPYKDRRAVVADLKLIYTATDQDAAADQLAAFAKRWDHRFPTISRSWLTHWEQITAFLAFPPDVRRAVYTLTSPEQLPTVTSSAYTDNLTLSQDPRGAAVALQPL
jgi:transposase-like protein